MNIMTLIFLSAIALAAMILLIKPRSRKQVIRIKVQDPEFQQASQKHNKILTQLSSIDQEFTTNLSALQKKTLLYQDKGAFYQLKSVVTEYNKSMGIIKEKLTDSQRWILEKRYHDSEYTLTYLEKDLEYLKKLKETLKMISIEDHTQSFYRGNKDDIHSTAGPDTETTDDKPSVPNDNVHPSYFEGCQTKEEIQTRYKALARVFHPDNKYGDEGIFRKIKEEYESLI